MASVYERITNALSSLGKRRERDNDDGGRENCTMPGSKGRTPNKRFRPWDQSDLHQRLETFKQLTWFGKPEAVGPVPCALRGWINDAKDSLSCERCNAKLIYPSNIAYDQQQAAADLFLPNLLSKHSFTCPWRKTSCNASLLAYNPNSNSNEELCQMFQTLQGKLLKVDVLPDLDAIAIQAIRDAAMPFGSYDDMVMCGLGDAGALTPVQRHTAVRITDVTGEEPEGANGSSVPSFSDAVLNPSAATPTFILQPSKMTPQQKASFLALLGWDVDVLQPDSASGSAALPYTQSAGYGLGHLGVKPKSTSAATAGTTNASSQRYPMSSVVLKCPHCNCRTGLWNFSGLRPVPMGRLTPAQQAAGMTALLSTNTTVAGGTAGGGDTLSMTIAGGLYGLHGPTRSSASPAVARPFGATSSAPFRFGSTSSTEPVFGIAAMDAEAQRMKSSDGGVAAAFTGIGTPKGRSDTAPATAGFCLTGQKRKTGESDTPLESMALESAGAQTPGKVGIDVGFSFGAGSGLTDSKRPRLDMVHTIDRTPLSMVRGCRQAPLPPDSQLPELDPVGQHRSWCPWIYTGTREAPQMSGWQHMLQALAFQQQQQQQQLQQQGTTAAAAATGSASAGAGPMEMTQTGIAPTGACMDARQLKDNAIAAIRSL